MRATLSDCELLDRGAAYRTRTAIAPIHAKMILILAAAIDPIYAGAVAADAFLKNGADRLAQSPGLFLGDIVGSRQRVQLRDVQTFIGINIAKPGNEGLVKKQGF